MISMVQPLPAGNAIRVLVMPPEGATRWRLLRRTDSAFAGPTDPDAVLVAYGDVGPVVPEGPIDRAGLINGTTYVYRDFAEVGGRWIAGSTASGMPAASYSGDTEDPQSLVRERLELGLAEEVKRGVLVPQSGKVRVITAPFATEANITFPVVSVHLASEAPAERGIGEELMPPTVDPDDGDVADYEGWLGRVELNIVGVSLNADERIALRRALRRIVVANLPIFDAAGMTRISFSQRDEEQFTEKGTPLFMAVGSLDCIAPFFVAAEAPAVSAANVTLEVS